MEGSARKYKVEKTESDSEGEPLIDDSFLREWVETEDRKEILDTKCDVNVLHAGSRDYNTVMCNGQNKKEQERNIEISNGEANARCMAKSSRDIDQLIEELCKNAPISEKAASLCMFKCPKCREN